MNCLSTVLCMVFTYKCSIRVPTRTGKPGKMGRYFPVKEKSGILNRLENSGKITQDTGKVKEFQANVISYFLVIFKWTVYYLLKWIRFSTLKKYWENQGKVRKCCKARKVGTMSIPLNEYKVTNWRYFWIGKPPIQRSVVCDVALAIGIAPWELNQELKMPLSWERKEISQQFVR